MEGIEKMFPTQERIELFARRRVEGWSVWGLDMIIDSNEPFTLKGPSTSH